MVSFVCNTCQETLKKPKLDKHKQRCRNAQYSCIDCNTDFYGDEYRKHTSCISEAEKYQKDLYKKKPVKNHPQHTNHHTLKRASSEHSSRTQKKVANYRKEDSTLNDIMDILKQKGQISLYDLEKEMMKRAQNKFESKKSLRRSITISFDPDSGSRFHLSTK